jgi:hypothetical protein
MKLNGFFPVHRRSNAQHSPWNRFRFNWAMTENTQTIMAVTHGRRAINEIICKNGFPKAQTAIPPPKSIAKSQ